MKRDKNFKRIDRLFKLNKLELRKQVKRMSREAVTVNVEVKRTQEQYTKLFNEKNQKSASKVDVREKIVSENINNKIKK